MARLPRRIVSHLDRFVYTRPIQRVPFSLSWFAFPPLIPEAIKKDLGLTTAQVGEWLASSGSHPLLSSYGYGWLTLQRYNVNRQLEHYRIMRHFPCASVRWTARRS
jgi:hypothetical protein